MKPDAREAVALKSKQKAQSYKQTGNVGRSFAHFLVALKLMPQWKNELKLDFSSTLCTWGGQLESQKRYKDLFTCYEQALEIFPDNEEVLCNLGAHLFRLGHLREAAHYFRQSLEINSDYLPAYRNLQSVCNALVERWHFRMLNDSHRNQAYKEAIFKKVQQGLTSVLDIGTGTAIFSLYAVASGAKEVHACDYSSTMCAIARDILDANNASGKVKLINKLSNNLTIPRDIPHRKSLVITETMDCGLLGEHMLQTLLHAWDHLLKPPCPQLMSVLDAELPLVNNGVVLPFGARLWATAIQCSSIARHNYIFNIDHDWPDWDFKNMWLISDSNEPYDTENLRNIKDCKFLCDPINIFTFDFNDPSQLKAYYRGENDAKCVSFAYEGTSDALAVWFDIILDEDITITSSPLMSDNNCCWDQAIFKFMKPQESVTVQVKCSGGNLRFETVSQSQMNLNRTNEKLTDLSSSLQSTSISSGILVSPEMICFINDKVLQDVLYMLPDYYGEIRNVLDLSPFPSLGLRFLQLKNVNLFCVLKSENEVTAVKEFVKNNNLDPVKVNYLLNNEVEELLSTCNKQFDFIANHLFESDGELKEKNINMIPRLMRLLSPEGVLAPVSVSVVCQLLECEWVSRTSAVLNNELTQICKIAEFVNLYQVSQQVDVDLNQISHSCLSGITVCLQLNNAELAEGSCRTEILNVKVVKDGCVTAISMWYQYQLRTGGEQLSTFTDNSHVNQLVFAVNPPFPVRIGDTVSVHVTYHCGIIRLKIIS